MSVELSASKEQPFGVFRVMKLLGRRSRSGFYAARRRLQSEPPTVRRGPKTQYADDELTALIRETLACSPFLGEGHRKAWAQLRHRGIRTSKARVLRLMREARLLSPGRPRRELGPRAHNGTIVPSEPNHTWGTDLTTVLTSGDGVVSVFATIDHFTADCVGIHAAARATRFEALEPLRQGIREHFGGYRQAVASGLKLRHDNGSQYVSDAFQTELHFLGIESSPSFVRAPEGNGCIERFFRTLKEQLLWIRSFQSAEQVRLAVIDWAKLYNERWLIERHGYRSPNQVRTEWLAARKAA